MNVSHILLQTDLECPSCIGSAIALAIVATAGDRQQFRNGREFAAWLGLTPINRSSGRKERLWRITIMGDKYVRRLRVAGMTAPSRHIKNNPERTDPRAIDLLGPNPPRLTTEAIANKTARIVLAVLTRTECYRPHTVLALRRDIRDA
ncbi:MAG: transposase [Paracoccaceae bacterium]